MRACVRVCFSATDWCLIFTAVMSALMSYEVTGLESPILVDHMWVEGTVEHAHFVSWPNVVRRDWCIAFVVWVY